jgi:hypothetical protein
MDGCGEGEVVQVTILLVIACSVLFIVPLYFVVNSVYQDGVFGRGSLLGISFCSASILGDTAIGTGFYVPPVIVMLISFFAVFSVWHLVRFHTRVAKREPWKPVVR